MMRIASPTLARLLAFLGVLLTAVPASGEEPPANFALQPTLRAMPDLTFADEAGDTVILADFSGKVVLLNIWATWCAPCRREMPALDRLQEALGGSDFQVVALSIDRAGLEVVKSFYAEIGIRHLKMFIDSSGKAAVRLGLVGLPTSFLIDRRGREIGRLVGPAERDDPEMADFLRSVIAGTGEGSLWPGQDGQRLPARYDPNRPGSAPFTDRRNAHVVPE